jgi:phosphoribosylglycinamide formyltransferase 1
MTTRRRTAILISGRGSNMMSLVEAARAPAFPAEIVAVISNRPDAAGIAWAAGQGIATHVVDHKAYGAREGFEHELHNVLAHCGADIVCLAGFMRVLTPGVVHKWQGRMLNIHPSLLPAFPGLQTHERALAAGVKISGCSVHFVVPEMDAGPIVAQAAVAVHDGDTADGLAARILEVEHKLYPHALRLVASGAIRIENGRATTNLAAPATDDAAAINHGNVVFSPPLTGIG